MGSWSPSILSSDTACDIRAEFRFLIGEGLSAQEATERLLAENQDSLDDPDIGPDIWLGLAATQVECGRLLPAIKDKALAIINSGEDLERWRELAIDEDPGLIRKRAAALEKLKAQLLGPQRSPTKIRKQYIERTDWEIGHAIAYRLLSGKWTIMRVIHIETAPHDARYPIVELCDWFGTDFPPSAAIETLPQFRTKQFEARLSWLKACAAEEQWPAEKLHDQIQDLESWENKLALYSHSPRHFPADRVHVLATGLETRPVQSTGTIYFGGWAGLDEYLLDAYGIE